MYNFSELDRPSIHTTFMDIAWVVSERGTCPRLQVGAVLVRDDLIVGTGFNGAPRGLSHCFVNCSNSTRCKRSQHAEVNAIVNSYRFGSQPANTLYSTHSPCPNCAGAIINAGITKVIYEEEYRSEGGIRLLQEADIPVIQYHDLLDGESDG